MDQSFRNKLKSVVISGREVFPIVEGGKGIAATNGYSSGGFCGGGLRRHVLRCHDELIYGIGDHWGEVH